MLVLTCRASVASKLGVLMSTDKESHLAKSVYDVETMANVSTVLFCRKQTTSNFRLRTSHSAATARRSGIARCIGPENVNKLLRHHPSTMTEQGISYSRCALSECLNEPEPLKGHGVCRLQGSKK